MRAATPDNIETIEDMYLRREEDAFEHVRRADRQSPDRSHEDWLDRALVARDEYKEELERLAYQPFSVRASSMRRRTRGFF